MWKNYLTTGFRALTRSRTYAFINIFGLGLGLAACLLLLLYVRYETSYDKWLPDSDRVFQVQTYGTDASTGERIETQGVTQPVAEALAKDFPQMEAVSKLETDDLVVLQDGAALKIEDAGAVDERFFDIIQLKFLIGDPKRALAGKDSLVLSLSSAVRLFRTPDILGRTVTTVRDGKKYDLRITGVFADLPKNSHMGFNAVRRFNSEEEFACPWGCVNGSAYVKLKPGVDVASINGQMQAWEKRNVPPLDIGGSNIGKNFDWRLVNVADVHLGPAQDGARPGNDMRSIVTFAIVALLILAMACVNFVNLATAHATRRAREVAVRKVLGAKRTQLVSQFIGESTLLVAIAMLIALAMVEMVLPTFSAWLDSDLDLAYFGEGGIAGSVIALTLAVGLVGGLYPAFYLSRYQPGAVLKANQSSPEAAGTGRLRNLLVIAQFAVSIALMTCTAIVYHQSVYARTADPGYDGEGLLTVRGLQFANVQAVQDTLAQEFARIEGVRSVAKTKIIPGDGPTFFTTVQVPGAAEPRKLGWYSVEPAFFDTLKIDFVAGRNLSLARAADNIRIDPALEDAAAEKAAQDIAKRGFNVVVNELAARQLGFRSGAEAIGKQVGIPAFGETIGAIPATIVGVVENSRFRSVREPIEPMIFHDAGYYRWLALRVDAASARRARDKVETIWKKLLPEEPLDASFTEEKLDKLYKAEDARGHTFAGFAGLAIVIACLGLFGLAAFTAERRTKEIGIRKVFGARVRDIVALLAWQFSKPVVIANIVAWPAAWWVMRDWLNGFDARIDLGPGPFLLAGLLALATAIGTVSGHALRVARMSPIHALRYE
jgi:putative ABC transport system permease protein